MNGPKDCVESSRIRRWDAHEVIEEPVVADPEGRHGGRGEHTIGAILVLFVRFWRRQWPAVGVADALLTGTPADLVRGRQTLREVELYAWASRSARFCELLVGPVGVLCATAWWRAGNVSIWLPVALAFALASFSTLP